MTRGLFLCPADPKHGPLMAFAAVLDFYCPHADHDGRPGANPPTPASRNWFTFAEIDNPGAVAGMGTAAAPPSRTPVAIPALPGDQESRRVPVVRGRRAGAR